MTMDDIINHIIDLAELRNDYTALSSDQLASRVFIPFNPDYSILFFLS